MRWIIRTTMIGVGALSVMGCASRPLIDNPALLRVDPAQTSANPTVVPLGPAAYAVVFETVLDSVDDFFEIAYANRYDGTIRTHTLTAPGFEQPWKPGSPNARERLLATLQTIRYRCDVTIQPGEPSGYLVAVAVHKDLEDLPGPIRATAGAAAFRSDVTVDRQLEVVGPIAMEQGWVPAGQECHLEQLILQRINKKIRDRSMGCNP